MMIKTIKHILLFITGLVFTLSLSSCSVYKMEVQQGNALSQEAVSQLRPGMTKSEVSTLLGNPLLQDDFHSNRWDYVYFSNKNGKKKIQKNITLLFKNERLVQVK